MFKQLTYRQKNRMLLIAMLLSFMIAYWAAVRKTITIYQENDRLTATLALARHAPERIQQLEARKEKISYVLSFEQQNLQKELLEKIATYTARYDIQLSSFAVPVVSEEQDLKIESYEMILEGDYYSLIKAVYALEQKLSSARLASVSFYSEKDRRTRQTKLFSKLIIQNMQEL